MWDPAHGKPYASAQLALSFGVGGLGPVSTQAVDKCSLGDLNCFFIMLLLSHHRGMLFRTGFCQGTRCCFSLTEVKCQRELLSLSLSENWMIFLTKALLHFHQGGCFTHQLLPSLPSFPPDDLSLHPREVLREVVRILALPGATGSLCHPLTQTAGSALHTRIIRR